MRPFGQVPARPGIELIRPAGLVVGGYPCTGVAGSSQSPDGTYYLTTFGGGSDTQHLACLPNGPIADGTWYYMADNSRFGCGSKVKITNPANGRAVIAQVADYGPDRCVEAAAGREIIDASPLVSQYLFGTSSSGYSQHREVVAQRVDSSMPLGPTSPASSAPIIALVLAVMAGAAIWYMEKLPKRNPMSSILDEVRRIKTRTTHGFYVGDRRIVSVRKDGPGHWFVEMEGAPSRSFQFAQYTPAEFTASMGSARVHGGPVAIAKMVERLMSR